MTALAQFINYETWRSLPDDLFCAFSHHLLSDIMGGEADAAYLQREPSAVARAVVNAIWGVRYDTTHPVAVDKFALLPDAYMLQVLVTGYCEQYPTLGSFFSELTTPTPAAQIIRALLTGSTTATEEDVAVVRNLGPLTSDHLSAVQRWASRSVYESVLAGDSPGKVWDAARRYLVLGGQRTIINYLVNSVSNPVLLLLWDMMYKPFSLVSQIAEDRLTALTQQQLVHVITRLWSMSAEAMVEFVDNDWHMRRLLIEVLDQIEVV